MDVNTTVAVNIMIKASMGNAQKEFRTGLDIMAKDAAMWASRMNSTFASAFKSSTFTQAGQQAGQAFTQGFQRTAGGGGGGGGGGGSFLSGGGHFGFFQQVFGANVLAGITIKTLEEIKDITQSIIELGTTAVQKAAEFERMTKAIEVFAGSTFAARTEIASLDAVARSTPGLRLENAEQGYQRLRALNFQAELARDLITGIGKQRLISGTDEANVQRVIVNFTQLARSTARAGMDLREIIHAIPTMGDAFQRAFGTVAPTAIAKLIDANPAAFFTKLAKAMNDTAVAAPGLTVGFEKFLDALIEAQRAFGGPLLEPLTIFFGKAKDLIYENLNTLKNWGESLAEDVRFVTTALENHDWGAIGSRVGTLFVQGFSTALGGLANIAITGIGQTIGESLSPSALADSMFTKVQHAVDLTTATFERGQYGRSIGVAIASSIIGGFQFALGDSIVGSFFTGFTGAPDNTNANERLQVKLGAAIALNANQDQGTPIDTSKFFSKNLSEAENQRLFDQVKKNLEDIQKAVKETPSMAEKLQTAKANGELMELLDTQRKLQLTIAQGQFNISSARVALNPNNTPADTANNASQLLTIQRNYIEAQIREQKKGYEAEIQANADDKQKVQILELREKEAIQKLRDQATVDEINNQKAIEAAQREMFDRRLKAAEQFYRTESDSAKLHNTAMVNELARQLALGQITQQQFYAGELQLEDTQYAQQLVLLRTQLQLQLQDRKLIAEDIFNLKKQEGIEEEKLAVDHAQKIFETQQKNVENQKQLIQELSDSTVRQMTDMADAVGNALDAMFGERSTWERASVIMEALTAFVTMQTQEISTSIKELETIRANARAAGTSVRISRPSNLAPIMQAPMGTNTPVIIDAITGQPISVQEAYPNLAGVPNAQRNNAGAAQMSSAGKIYLTPQDVQRGAPAAVQSSPAVQQAEQTSQAVHSIIDDDIEYLRQSKANLDSYFAGIAAAYATFDATAKGIDEFAQKRLNITQDAESKALLLQIETQRQIVDLSTEGHQRQVEQQKLNQLIDQDRILTNKHLVDQEQLYRTSIVGLEKYNAALAAGDKIAVAYAENKAIKNRLNEEAGLREQLITLNDRLNNSATVNGLQIQVAAVQRLIDLRYKETQIIIDTGKAEQDLADQTIYHADQANLKVLQFLASQKGVTEIMVDFRIGLINSGYDVIDKGLDRIIPKMGMLHNVIKDLLSSLIKLALNSAFRALFVGAIPGGPSASSGGGGIGGIISTINSGSSGGGILGTGGIFGSTPAPTPNIANQLAANIQQSLGGGQQIPGIAGVPTVVGAQTTGASTTGQVTGAAGAARGIFGNSGIGRFLQSPAFAGALAGLGIGVGIGGPSGIGQVIGGVGGALLGGAGGAIVGGILTGGLAGLSAALFATPFAIIGGALLGLALWFGHRAKVNREKKQVTQATTDAVQKIQQLIADVKSFKIDGASAIQQGQAIRDTFAEMLSHLTTGTGKKLGQQKLAEIDSMLATLKIEADRSDRASTIARSTDEGLVPTFATGGFTGLSYGATPAILHSSEVVLNQGNIMALGGYRALQNAGVRGIDMSGAPDRYYTPRKPTSSGVEDRPIYIIAAFGEEHANSMFDLVSPYGLAKKVKVASNRDLAGMNNEIARQLAGE